MAELNTKNKMILALEVEDFKAEQKQQNYIIIKNKSFKLNEEQKSLVEAYYNIPHFTKTSFSTKNSFLFKNIKTVLEAENYIFKESAELQKELADFKIKRTKELEAEQKAEAEAEEQKTKKN